MLAVPWYSLKPGGWQKIISTSRLPDGTITVVLHRPCIKNMGLLPDHRDL
jgi:hypothetical protein